MWEILLFPNRISSRVLVETEVDRLEIIIYLKVETRGIINNVASVFSTLASAH